MIDVRIQQNSISPVVLPLLNTLTASERLALAKYSANVEMNFKTLLLIIQGLESKVKELQDG